jgi:hypothetical protein
MKLKQKIIIFLATFLALFIIILVPVIVFPQFIEYAFYSPRVKRIYTPDSGASYAVLFNQGALQGSSDYLGVIDESKEDPNLIILGPVRFTDITLFFQRIVISLDKTVIAAELKYNSKPFWHAYDFANSVCYGSALYPGDEDPNMTEARTQAIQELIQLRGGINQEFPEIPWNPNEANKLSWLAWRKWQAQVDKVKETRQPWKPIDAAVPRD